ncbi:hypothetical protein BDF19DRAFT_430211, partial [Syncephalis fuscata]
LGIGAFLGCLITMVFYLTFTDAAPIVGSLIPLHDEYDVYGLGRGTYKIDNSGDLKNVLKKILKDNNIAIKNSAPAAVPVVPTPTNPILLLLLLLLLLIHLLLLLLPLLM